ncbi:hypothetical protein PENTCL1PPCAC_26177, partial [Pristionchus entomophagus]
MIFPGELKRERERVSVPDLTTLNNKTEATLASAKSKEPMSQTEEAKTEMDKKKETPPPPTPPPPPPPPQQIVVKIEQPKTQPTSSDPPKSEEAAPKKKKCCP